MEKPSFQNILSELAKIQAIVVDLQQKKEIAEIDRDVLLSKLRVLYDEIFFLKTSTLDHTVQVATSEVTPVRETAPEISKPEAVVVEPTKEPEPSFEIEPEPLVIAKPEVKTVKEEPEWEISQPEETAVPPKPEVPKVVPEKKQILAEKFEKKGYLHEALTNYATTNDLSKKFQSQPVKDIFSVIGLNEKFLFIRELFGSDAALYQATLTHVNSAANFNDAIKYIDSNFNWDFENPVVQKILELIHRRFL
jgi:hypothetical protein